MKFITKTDLEKNVFFRLPKGLLYNERYKDLSASAKLLYAFLYDRVSMSLDNEWIDEKGRVYVICEITEIEVLLSCARSTACKLLKELEKFGLVVKDKNDNFTANLIYVCDVESCSELISIQAKHHKSLVEITKTKRKDMELLRQNKKSLLEDFREFKDATTAKFKNATRVANAQFSRKTKKMDCVEQSDFNASSKSEPGRVAFLNPKETEYNSVVVISNNIESDEFVDNVDKLFTDLDFKIRLLITKFLNNKIKLNVNQINMLKEFDFTVASDALNATIAQAGRSFNYFYKVYKAYEKENIENFIDDIEWNSLESIVLDTKKASKGISLA